MANPLLLALFSCSIACSTASPAWPTPDQDGSESHPEYLQKFTEFVLPIFKMNPQVYNDLDNRQAQRHADETLFDLPKTNDKELKMDKDYQPLDAQYVSEFVQYQKGVTGEQLMKDVQQDAAIKEKIEKLYTKVNEEGRMIWGLGISCGFHNNGPAKPKKFTFVVTAKIKKLPNVLQRAINSISQSATSTSLDAVDEV